MTMKTNDERFKNLPQKLDKDFGMGWMSDQTVPLAIQSGKFECHQ
jgi:hypothetical protein